MSPLTLVTDSAPAMDRTTRSVPSKRILADDEYRRIVAAYSGRIDVDLTSQDLSPAVGRTDTAVEPNLRGVLRDTLAHPGSLLRAQLAYDVQRRHGVEPERALDLAIAIEYFHSASLLFDDLPSMDDGSERRGRTCPHRVYGEAATQLAALALITRAYALLWRSFAGLPADRSLRAAELVGECLGSRGILDGQSRDLHPPTSWTAHEVQRVAEGKTVTLIRLSLVLPALVAGVCEESLADLESLARAWGLAYQVVDDFKDHLLTAQESGKTPHRDRAFRRPNLPSVLGADAALVHLRRLLDEAARSVETLSWTRLSSVHRILEAEYADVADRLDLAACA